MIFRRKKPAPSDAVRVDSLSSSAPSRPAGPVSDRSVIGRNTRFRGDIRGRGPLTVRGQVEGSVGIEDRLLVEHGASLDAESRAAEVIVAGRATGTLLARERLTVRPTGTVEGKIQTDRFRVEEGGLVTASVTRPGTSHG